MKLKLVVYLVLSISLVACGGGGGGGGNSGGGNNGGNAGGGNAGGGNSGGGAMGFGLETRAALAVLSLPTTAQGNTTFNLANAYPNLSFSAPLFAAQVPGEGRIVVVEQGGRIVVFVDDAAATALRELIDIPVLFSGEQGLLGLAFDPDFLTNRFVYVHYSLASPRRSRIARFTWDEAQDLILSASEKIVLELEQPFSNHNGGMLAFGPDDYLYIAFGDGGDGGDPLNHGQDRSTLHGNILRIDVHPANPSDGYDVPADNPFVGVAGVAPEIFANGLRNPFRFSFDRQTGELWLGDVGQGNLEEVDIITAGGNYGWRVFEGTQPFNGSGNTLPSSAFTPPIFEYDHSEGQAIIGGYVYRGPTHASLLGKYLFSDFSSGTVWSLEWDGTTATRETITTASSPTSFAEKSDGEVLVVSRNSGLFEFVASGGGGFDIPNLLSETGLFTNLTDLTPASGLIEYDVAHPFWSDGATKRRWYAMPDAAQLGFSNDTWTFPEGAIAVKHFEIDTGSETRRLETRVLVNTDDGWLGFTYRWNESETDADLLLGRETEVLSIGDGQGGSIDQTYEYPSRTDCLACHTDVAGGLLGLRTPQMNIDFAYALQVDNQLRSWNNIDLFSQDIGDTTQYETLPSLDGAASFEERARTYLDVNCSQCHQPGGATSVNIDLRRSVSDAGLNAIGVPPQAGTLGVAGANIITAGEKETSTLWLRMQRLDSERMPPLSSHVVDEVGLEVVGQWIDAL